VDVRITAANKTSTPIPVAVSENFGDERRISVRVGEELLNLTTTEEVSYEKGAIIHLELNSERTHLFDPVTGIALQAH
jgi:multiple sugar transport system ATP-binding protein